MGFGDLVSSGLGGIADKASSLLGGGAPPPAMEKAEAKFVDSGPIDEPSDTEGGAAAPDHDNKLDTDQLIEFIHYGHAHRDDPKAFRHESFDDTATAPIKTPPGPRGIMFRDAVEREAVLRGGFVQSAIDLLTEIKKNTGGISDAVGALTSLAGGGKSSNTGTDPDSLKPYLSAITSAGGKVNTGSVLYPGVHDAGKNLQQAWANWNAFAAKMASDSNAGASPGMFGKLTDPLKDALGSTGIGDIITTITTVLFAMFDVYKGWYFVLREPWEPVIQEACYARGIEAIRKQYAPVFDIWSSKPGPPPPKPGTPKSDAKIANLTTGINEVDSLADKVNKPYDDAVDSVHGLEDKWRDFWDAEPDGDQAGPGQAYVKSALDGLKGSDQILMKSFSKTTKLDPIPAPVATVVSELCASNYTMLGKICLKLQDPTQLQSLTQEAFDGAGAVYILEKLHKLVNGFLPKNLPSALTGDKGPGGDFGKFQGVSSQMVQNKADSLLDSELGPELDEIVKFAMSSLYTEILQIGSDASKANALIMEAYLSRLPYLLALVTRNTVFPVFQLVADKVFGKASDLGGLATSPIKKLMGAAKDQTKDARNKIDDLHSSIDSKMDDAKSSLDSLGKYGMHVSAPTDAVKSLAKSVFGDAAAGDSKGGGGSFPGDPRVKQAAAPKIPAGDVLGTAHVV